MKTEMSIGELAKAAGVTVRTIRFYVAEGLLAEPQKKGSKRIYSSLHLSTLRLIGALKAAYLPLGRISDEISGLSESDMDRLLSEIEKGKGGYHNLFPPRPTIIRDPGEGMVREERAQYGKDTPSRKPHADLPPPEYMMTTENWKKIQIRDGVELHFKAARDPKVLKWIEDIVVHARQSASNTMQ